MVGRAGWLVIVVLCLGGCTVDDLHSSGRPCSTTAPCGPGAVCGPVGLCVRVQEAGPGDGAPDARIEADKGPVLDLAPQGDRSTPEGGPPDIKLPPDMKAPPDMAQPKCVGLTCPLGCNSSANRCYRLKASNFNVTAFEQVTHVGVVSSSKVVIDTDTGMITDGLSVVRQANKPGLDNGIHWSVVSQGAGHPELSVFVLVSITLPSGRTASVVGKRALAIYATGDIQIMGIVSADPGRPAAGTGGFAGGVGGPGASCFGGQGGYGSTGNDHESGGGGGGRKAAGGDGGDGLSTPGASGGQDNGVVSLVPLYGGCGGGAGGYGSIGGDGGGGGGAIQLAANGSITITGLISMPGAGGEGSPSTGAGGGGGSGGAILLEAPTVTVSGTLAANGGGGGSGGSSSQNGQGGQGSAVAAKGGVASSPYGGTGGLGGALGSESGGNGQSGKYNGGGGGGGAGRIRINALQAASSGLFSPAPSKSTTLGKW